MKNAKLENLIEALSVEPSSLDYDSVFSSVQKIDSKAHELAKGYGVPVNSVYNAIDFDPAAYVKICAEDTDILDFSYSDIMRDLQLLEKQLVPEEHRKYGGKMAPLAAAMMVLMAPAPGSENLLNYIKEKSAPIGGEPVKRKEIVLKEDMGLVDYIIKGIRKHKTAIGLGILGTLGLYVGVNSLVNANKEHSDDTDVGIAKAKAGIFGRLTGTLLNSSNDTLAPTPAPTVANGSATPVPAPERYQLNYGGILIKGDKQFIKDVVISLEFGKEYYPEGELKYTKEIKASNATPEMAAGEGHTFVNPSAIHKRIETGGIVTVLADFGHEEWHNYASQYDTKNNTEENAEKQGGVFWDKLINMNESEKKKFVEEFDFSKYEKEIQTI